ncbi:HCO3 transporter family-domain-containing protein [Tuber borchii]|uniref:HCO3 transporter family-domain-containing protein n=1 Tax=Tuber borchii TaxID=42251 RepID=A0A2T6ZEW1_TUBBO|nr:HCO3 transporter family-domain-containing protein [Tuber borchii]
MVNDVRRRLPYYKSDWTDAWDYRIVPSTGLFCLLPDSAKAWWYRFEKTKMSYGVNEVLLASVLGAVVFSFLAAQPLCIVGVTGPITVFNYTVYAIVTPRGIPYFQFMCWICLWSMLMHFAIAITNACNAVKWVTRFSCDIFGFYVAFIYLQKGIQVLTLQWRAGDAAAYLSISISLLVLMSGYACSWLGNSSLFRQPVRVFLKDYGTPLSIVCFTGYQYIGKMKHIELERLPVSQAFFPTMERGWLVHFWDISVGQVFLAIPFALLLTILFYFDHNVSSLISQGTEFPLKKPAGFHWDIFLLGITTGISGVLGIPAPNGLIPQAPFHTASLCVTRRRVDEAEENKGKTEVVVDHVVEQRVSNLAQGLLILGTMTGPLLVVLALIPQGVLAGLFFVMGLQALEANGITLKLLFLFRDDSLTSAGEPLKRCRKGAVWAFVALELVGFGATFAITQTIAAIGFPVFIFLLIPARTLILPNYFTPEELGVLDAPTASPFTLESVGGGYDDAPESSDDSTPAEASSDTLAESAESVMERGDSVKLSGRRSSAVRHSIDDGSGDRVEEAGSSGTQHRRTTAK